MIVVALVQTPKNAFAAELHPVRIATILDFLKGIFLPPKEEPSETEKKDIPMPASVPATPTQKPAAPPPPPQKSGTPGSFIDVYTSDKEYEAVEYLKAQGIVGGYTDQTFRPEQTMNRAEFVKIVIGALYATEHCVPSEKNSFSDTELGAWYAPYLCVSKMRNIVDGYSDGTFRPEQTVNGAEVAKILAQTLHLHVVIRPNATDQWYEPYWKALQQESAVPEGLSPGTAVTRGAMAEMLFALKDSMMRFAAKPDLSSSSSSIEKINARRASSAAAVTNPTENTNPSSVGALSRSSRSAAATSSTTTAATQTSSTHAAAQSSSAASTHSSSTSSSSQSSSSSTQLSSSISSISSASSSLGPVNLPSDPNDPINKTVLNQGNFSYLGSFKIPTSDGAGCSTSFSKGGMTHRYVGGQLQFILTATPTCGDPAYEVNYPGISVSSPPTAQVIRSWGDIYDNHRWVGNDGGSAAPLNGSTTYGLFYDQQSSRLYWNYGHWYNSSNPYNPSVGYTTLNDTTGVADGVGAWSLSSRLEKFSRGGTLRIPQWFADRYTGGKAIGVGFGGYFSIISTGSFGPALAAIDAPDSGSADRSALNNVPLIGYPYTSGTYTSPDRTHRDTDYHTENDGWNPQGGIGYWTWSDIIYSGASWIDLPNKHGVLFMAKIGQGRIWYESADRHAERGQYLWMVYDPKDLAAVATGQRQQWEIQPKYQWYVTTLPMPIDQSGWAGDGYNQIGGATFDATTNRLYVLVNSIHKSGVEWYPQVFVYQVN